MKAELFLTSIRSLDAGIAYSTIVALLGGSSELNALAFKDYQVAHYFNFYVTACIITSLLVYFFIPDTKETSTLIKKKQKQKNLKW